MQVTTIGLNLLPAKQKGTLFAGAIQTRCLLRLRDPTLVTTKAAFPAHHPNNFEGNSLA